MHVNVTVILTYMRGSPGAANMVRKASEGDGRRRMAACRMLACYCTSLGSDARAFRFPLSIEKTYTHIF
jgi:hypothetical protein